MRKKYPRIVSVLVVLAMALSLVAALAVPAVAQTATIDLNYVEGPVGQSVTVTAENFQVGSILTVKFDGSPLSTAPAVVEMGAGAKTFAIAVPSTTAGAHTITVSNGPQTDTATFTVQPKVTISPATGPVGTSATVTGTGFAAGVTADVFFTLGTPDPADDLTFAAGALVDVDGHFEADGTVPGLASGAQEVSAADGAGNSAVFTATFNVTPKLTVSPAAGLAGASVTLTGTGWKAGDPVNFTFAGQPWPAASTTATGSGSISVSAATLPGALPGVKKIVGNDGTNTASTNFTVDPRVLTLTPNSGPMGINVLVTGSDMSPDPAKIPVGGVEIGGVAWNDEEIKLSTAGVIAPTTLMVPAGLTPGANTVLAVDTQALAATATFTVTKPTITANPDTGPRGSSLTVTGSGWVPGKMVTLSFGGVPMSVIPNENGNIAAAMSVPATATAGANAITASDTAGNAAAPATYTVPGASVSITPEAGSQGSEVTISGTGFQGYTGIKITIGGYEFPTKPLTSPLGDFTFSAMIPGIAPGSAPVEADDGKSTAVTFFVVSKAPETVGSALGSIADKVVIVWDYAGGDWLFYDPDDPGSDLENLVAGSGYWIHVSEAVELIYGGHSYSLTEGWNNIGWLGA